MIPIVNENDTISTDEIEFGDNDTLSAVVASLSGADLLILLSDIDGLYTDDPNTCADARLIECIPEIDEHLYDMAKGSSSDLGTGGMVTKIDAGALPQIPAAIWSLPTDGTFTSSTTFSAGIGGYSVSRP